MQILKSLRERFSAVVAWQPGYVPMLEDLCTVPAAHDLLTSRSRKLIRALPGVISPTRSCCPRYANTDSGIRSGSPGYQVDPSGLYYADIFAAVRPAGDAIGYA